MDFMSILNDIQKTVSVVEKCRENLSQVLPSVEKYHDILFAVLEPIASILPPQYGTAIKLVHKYGDTVLGYLKAVQITEEADITEGIKGEEKLIKAVSIVTELPPEEIKPIVPVVKEESTVDTVIEKVQEGTVVTQKIISSIKGVQSIVDSINNLL